MSERSERLSSGNRSGIAAGGALRRIAAALLIVALLAGCAHKQLTNKQLAGGVVAVGAVVGFLVLMSMVADCEQKYGSDCQTTAQ